MSYVQRRSEALGISTALVLALMALAIAGTAIPAHAQYLYTPYSLQASKTEPGQPAGLVAQGRDGNLYGYSYQGGDGTACNKGCGTLYEMSPAIPFSPPTVLYSFHTQDNCNVGLTLGSDGNFYGVCTLGGAYKHGYVFQWAPPAVPTILGSFCSQAKCRDGGIPSSRLTEATPGTFYGTTQTGGAQNYGTVYQITPPGPMITLYSFTHSPDSNFTRPNGPLFMASDGNLYGTTQASTKDNPPCPPSCGAIYRIAAGGTPTVLHDFTGSPSDGATPTRGIIQGPDGNFYGTTVQGGTNNLGTFFQMTPSGSVTTLYSFATGGYGHPRGLALSSDLNFYGDANGCALRKGCLDDGTIYEASPESGFTPIVLFSGKNGDFPGAVPDSTLSHTLGILYGVTQKGGTFNDGVFYGIGFNAPPYCRPQASVGQVGEQIGILGQNFNNSSIVYFGGVQAPPPVLTGSNFITATVPAGAQTGLVTVTTTGFPTLNSLVAFHVAP